MQREESRYPNDWFRIGGKELKRAEYLLDTSDLDGASFNIHQAVEKFLKGYLLSKGWKLRRIHDLEILINEAVKYDPSFEKFRIPCQKINLYYMEERYPFVFASELNEHEVKDSLVAARDIIVKIKTHLVD